MGNSTSLCSAPDSGSLFLFALAMHLFHHDGYSSYCLKMVTRFEIRVAIRESPDAPIESVEVVKQSSSVSGYCSFGTGGRRVGVRVLCLCAYLPSIAR